MKVAISEGEAVYLRKHVLAYSNSTFARAEVRQALSKRGNFSLQCTNYGERCGYRLIGRKYQGGSVRVGCTLIPKETVALIRKWANAK